MFIVELLELAYWGGRAGGTTDIWSAVRVPGQGALGIIFRRGTMNSLAEGDTSPPYDG